MADIVDFERARERKVHERKEARVRKLRKAFKAVRESWGGESGNAGKPKGLFGKNRKGKKKK